ncbi:MAG: aminopeptidase P N-terminal domain-containing protein [Bdellovibrionales bacterium]|nr:aminopeptidase P N-terminal domain-containing protein [Bdellovibrionales bacterium]
MSKQANEFKSRRTQFLKQLGKAVAVLPSARPVLRNHDVAFPERQDSSFYYLTGFTELNSYCLFAPSNKYPFQMFVEPKDATKELWEGYIHGPEQARTLFGADRAQASHPDTFFDEAFVEAMCEADALYYRVGQDSKMDERIFELLQRASKKLGRTGRPFWPIHDPLEILGEMRCIKSAAEVELMAEAAQISADAHKLAMKLTKPGTWEYEIEALLFKEFRGHGAQRVGYNSIVATGANACVLHYSSNNEQCQNGDLLLIDAGAEYEYYSADITRTFPVNGQFSKPQREVYEAVLDVQKKCVGAVKPGTTVHALQEMASELLLDHLLRLKVLKGTKKNLLQQNAQKKYYPHGIGHWLGMDVHDAGRYYVGKYDEYRPLKPGMVLTIEPGLYFTLGPARYKGIGVRIEDDVVVTAKGCKVLTSGVPKEVEEVEAACRLS